ncbi:MAG: TrkH family potassium uptake protein [archaeon]
MNMNVVLRDVGILLKYMSPVFLLPIIVALIYEEYFTIIYFVLASLPMFALGVILEKAFQTDEKTSLKESLVTVSLIWLVITLIATIPYIGIEQISLLDAAFETMSAWTTTGFSLLVPEDLGRTMLFYRSMQQWFGGVGIVVLALAGLFKTGSSLYYAEARTDKIMPNILNTVKMIWGIYALYTIAGAALLALLGMSVFDAVNHSMTSIATGGLSTHSESIGYYNNPYIEFVVILIMIVGSVSFLSHYDLINGKVKKFYNDVFVRSLILAIIAGTLFVFNEMGFRTGLFTVVSAISSTGFNLDDIALWPHFSSFALIILMLVGGCAGATASGIKINRIVVVLKSIWWSVKRIRHPRHIFSRKFGNVSYNYIIVGEIFKFVALYLIFVVMGIFVFMYGGCVEDGHDTGCDMNTSIFQSVSAIGNSGLSVMSNYTPLGKIMAIFLMWIGRLEIWAIVIFLGYLAVKSNK